jgi:hypothetical protein
MTYLHFSRLMRYAAVNFHRAKKNHAPHASRTVHCAPKNVQNRSSIRKVIDYTNSLRQRKAHHLQRMQTRNHRRALRQTLNSTIFLSLHPRKGGRLFRCQIVRWLDGTREELLRSAMEKKNLLLQQSAVAGYTLFNTN